MHREQLTIGRFVVQRWLGSGLQGKVFHAFDTVLERQVAIKWLIPSGDGQIPSGDAMVPVNAGTYLSEARIVAQLQHPNIVPLYEAGTHQGYPFLVFAYVEGMTLREKRLHGGAMPVKEASAIFKGILDGVACAHAHGILHLDLSPSNIMIDTTGVPHVMDFGLAKLAGATAAGIEDGSLIGSPLYMSPEHFHGGQLSARSDVFALGLILYEMVTGRSPVQADSLQAIIEAIAEGRLDLGYMETIGLDARLQSVVERALSHDPYRRFADASEMKLVVDEFLESDARGGGHSTIEFLLSRMQRKANFPALSNNLLEINRLTSDNSRTNVAKLASVVLRDYAITNKLLKLANSSFYGRSNRGVKTVSDAIHLLGVNVIRLTCNGLAYFNAMKSEDNNLQDALISSFVAALIGRHFAIRLGRQDLAEEAFICGMFHRLGKSLTIFYFDEEYREIERVIRERALDEEAASTRVLGIGYGELGSAVAARWKFPEAIQKSIKYPGAGQLPEPADLTETQQQIAAFANELCELAARTPPNQGLPRLSEFSSRFAALIDISPAELAKLLRAALEKLNEFAPVFGFDPADSRFAGSISGFLDVVAALSCPADGAAGHT